MITPEELAAANHILDTRQLSTDGGKTWCANIQYDDAVLVAKALLREQHTDENLITLEDPWHDRVPMLSVHPDAATRYDIVRMASELMNARHLLWQLEQKAIEPMTEEPI